VSPAGLDFVEEQVPSYVPAHLEPPAITQTLFTCPGGRPVVATQQDTAVDIEVHDVDLSIPAAGTLRLDITLSVDAEGRLFLENPFLCFGETTCDDVLSLDHGRAVVDFEVSAMNGEPRVAVSAVELMIGPDDIDLTLSGCTIDDVLNWVIDFAKDWFMDYLVEKVEEVATTALSPLLEELVGGFTTFDGNLGIADFSAALDSVGVRTDGITAVALADLTSPLPPVACVGPDPGQPGPHAGAAPDLREGTGAHLGVAVNLGLIDDALYHAWAGGMTCVSSDELEAQGIDLHLDHVAVLLPGLPVGAEMSLEAHLATPPRVVGGNRSGADLTVLVEGAHIELTGEAPDGARVRFLVELDASASGRIGLEPGINALTLEMTGARIERLQVEEAYGGEVPFDVARLHQLLEDFVLPALFDELAAIPITGPVFGLADYYLILRDLGASSSHVWAKTDLFRAPADDRNAPTTEIVRQPIGVANPSNALVLVSGSDAEVPPELLRYRVTIDGRTAEPTYVRAVDVGFPGVTDTYEVHVAAVDLAGNEDPVGVSTTVTVDGITPQVALHGDRMRKTSDTRIDLAWSMDDDYTEPARLRPRLVVYRMTDRTDSLSAELVDTIDLAQGATGATADLEPGDLYRLEIVVADEAGNETRSSTLVEVTGAGGCNAGGRGAPFGMALVMLGALVALRRHT
jgi:uncharacterized protein (TIGR03382 family)